MKKIWKKTLLLAAVLCLTLLGGILAACGSNQTYSVKVVLPGSDETPVAGVELTFCDAEDESITCEPITTGTDGRATGTFENKNYRVKVTGGLPDGYGLSAADTQLYTKNWGSSTYLMVLRETIRTYTVTVALPSGTAAQGVDVIFTPSDLSLETERLTTDESGKVSIRLSTDVNYLVTLDEETLPSGFVVSAEAADGISTSSGTNIRFSLAVPVTYSFVVTGPVEANLEGIPVFYSATATGLRTPLGTTNANGRLSVSMARTTGFAFITAPEGYVYNEYYEGTSTNPSPYVLSDRGAINFTLIRNTSFPLVTPMTPEEQEAFGPNLTNRLDEGGTAYLFTHETDANRMEVLSFRAPEDGRYILVADFNHTEIKYYYGANFNNALNAINNKAVGMEMLCEAGKTYFISLQSTVAETVKIVLIMPVEANETIANDVGNYSLTIEEYSPAVLRFRPVEAGQYTVTIQDGASGYLIENLGSNVGNLLGTSANGSYTVNITQGELFYESGAPSGEYWIFRISVTEANPEYPVEIQINIQKTGNSTGVKDRVIEFVEVKEHLSQYGEQQGTLTQIGINGTNSSIMKGTDGLYHYGSDNGPVVVIKLKGEIPPFYVSSSEEEESVSFDRLDDYSAFYTFLIDENEERYLYYNYAKFLRGYGNYSEEDDPSAYVDEYYTKYVNSDGVYPLTDELIEFLKHVADSNKDWFVSCSHNVYTGDSLWLFSAYYYA